jgi:hypothetical protein
MSLTFLQGFSFLQRLIFKALSKPAAASIELHAITIREFGR